MYQVVWVPHYLLYIVQSFRENEQMESAPSDSEAPQ